MSGKELETIQCYVVPIKHFFLPIYVFSDFIAPVYSLFLICLEGRFCDPAFLFFHNFAPEILKNIMITI